MKPSDTLDMGSRNNRNVTFYLFGADSLAGLGGLLEPRRRDDGGPVLFFVDEFFESHTALMDGLPRRADDLLRFVSTEHEPTTDYVNQFRDELVGAGPRPCALVGIGGGSTMDVTKAIANLYTNPGRAEDYQGWDLVQNPGVFKIGVPTLSGTGSETTRTCVMTNKKTGLKLGMNSDHTVFDQIIMDPSLTATVPRSQYFFTGMDAYIHCIESTAGRYRNAVGDAFSRETLALCRQVFGQGDMMSPQNRERMMVASYLGGCAIASSYVGLIHPLSAGLSVVLGVRHCEGNCITMRAMEEFYPAEYQKFWAMAEAQGVQIPEGLARDLPPEDYERLYEASIMHEKPLTNALGEDFRSVLTLEKVTELFKKM